MLQADFDQIAGRLKSLSREGGSIEAAQVKLIGLDEIREAAGARWPRMRERVHTGSRLILSRFLGPDDVVIPAGDGFLIVLADAPAGSIQKRCQDMREALLSFYLGEDALKTLRPDVKSRALNADGLSDLIASSIRKQDDPHRIVVHTHDDEVAQVKVYVTQDRGIGALLLAPVVHERGARRTAYNADFILDGRHHTHKDYVELDIAIFDAALAKATAAKAAGAHSAVGFCVHASTMQHRRTREAYLSWLAEVDPELRRGLFIAIAEIEKGTPLISIAEWTSALRAHVARVWLDFHYTDHAIAGIGGAGASGAGFHLPIYTGAQKGPRAERMRGQIKFWARTVHGQGMRLIVNGFQEPEFLQEAGSLGVDFLTSDGHWPFMFPGQTAARAH